MADASNPFKSSVTYLVASHCVESVDGQAANLRAHASSA
jgi:hypothetical protein